MPKTTINDREYDIPEEELAKWEVKEDDDDGLFVPKKGEKYWIIGWDGEVTYTIFQSDELDRGAIATGNCYRTKAAAIRARDRQLALVRINRRIKELNTTMAVEPGTSHYRIYRRSSGYDYGQVGFHCVEAFDFFPMNTDKVATTIIAEYKDDLDLVLGVKRNK